VGSEVLRVLVAHRDPTERDYVAAALTGWGHNVTSAESPEDARARLGSEAVDVAFIDHALLAADRAAWQGRAAGGEPTAVIEMTEAADVGGVAPPYELTALRAALRGLTKEYA
jgi:CheY-like chemotaxis protein